MISPREVEGEFTMATNRKLGKPTDQRIAMLRAMTTYLLEKAKPVYETLPGWKCDIRGIKKYEDLPENCRNYIEFVEKEIGFPITMISNGPGRDDIIYRNK